MRMDVVDWVGEQKSRAQRMMFAQTRAAVERIHVNDRGFGADVTRRSETFWGATWPPEEDWFLQNGPNNVIIK